MESPIEKAKFKENYRKRNNHINENFALFVFGYIKTSHFPCPQNKCEGLRYLNQAIPYGISYGANPRVSVFGVLRIRNCTHCRVSIREIDNFCDWIKTV